MGRGKRPRLRVFRHRVSVFVDYPTIGEGEDVRIESEDLVGGALEVDGRILHLCAFCERTMDKDSPINSASRTRVRRRAWRRAA